MKTRLARSGLSLVEILVASGVLVAVMLPLFVLLSGSVRTTEVSLDEVQASLLAHEVLAQVRLLAVEPGFSNLPDLPVPNPPPLFPDWVALDDPQTPIHQRGGRLPHPVTSGDPRVEELETQGWTLFGAGLAGRDSVDPQPLLESLSRLYLSPAPDGFRRFLKVHPARLNARGDWTPFLRRIEVRVDWDRTFTGTAEKQRSMTLATLVGKSQVSAP